MSHLYRVNFRIANNEDLRQVFRVTDSAGVAVNLTGATMSMSIETPPTVDVVSATTANGRIVLTDPTGGYFTLAVPVSVISALAAGIYNHDLVAVIAGATMRLWTGTLHLSRGIT